MADKHILDELYDVIMLRKGDDPDQSYTARLFAKGPEKACEKVGEEATETIIEGVKGDNDLLAAESADLIYHLMVLWAIRGVTPAEIWDKLRERKGTSGLAEKAARERD